MAVSNSATLLDKRYGKNCRHSDRASGGFIKRDCETKKISTDWENGQHL
jgi:hypothetical protein